MKNKCAAGVAVLLLVGIALGLFRATAPETPLQRRAQEDDSPVAQRVVESHPTNTPKASAAEVVEPVSTTDDTSLSVSPEDVEERLVDEFDARVDNWMEPSTTDVTLKDVNEFNDLFKRVPAARRDECIHRALNLIPDQNVMLLVGILMDKQTNPEIAETIYSDVLNRDETVKLPILKQIYKDKSHPCWADTAWILDVTDAHRNKD